MEELRVLRARLGVLRLRAGDSNKLGPTGQDRLGKNVVGLDGFFFANFDLGGHDLRLRAGRQVISWGESTFIPNGINVINPVDLSKLRIPGSELKEGFIPTAGPVGQLPAHLGCHARGLLPHQLRQGAPGPARLLLLQQRFRLGRRQPRDPVVRSPAGRALPAGQPGAADRGRVVWPALHEFRQQCGAFNPAASIWAPRVADRNPSDDGQYGLAMRYLATELNNTEFALYYMNYHSRTPVFSGIKGTPTSALTGTPLGAALCQAAASNSALRALCHTGTAVAFTEYPEDIHLTGLSFNTAGPAGIALQGEYSYRPNQPVQYAAPEVLLAALGLPNLITGFVQIPGAPVGATAAALVPDGTYIQGWKRLKMSQVQVTATKSFPNLIGAEQLVLVGEAGYTKFHGLPTDVKFNAPAVHLPATSFGAQLSSAFSVQPAESYLTENSWGYRIAARMEYTNALFGGNLAPRYAFAHDVDGSSPTFNEGVKSQSLGITWDYQRRWLVDAQYTMFSGGRTYCGTDANPPTSPIPPGQSASWCGSANPVKDRDFFSVSVSYSF
jgi:hypothetical protein